MRLRSLQCARCTLLVVFALGCVYVAVKNMWDQARMRREEYERQAALRRMRGITPTQSNDSRIPAGQQACQHPFLPAGDKGMLALTWTAPTIMCTMRQDWVEVKGSKAHIRSAAWDQFGPIECNFTAILRTDDDLMTKDGSTTFTKSVYFFVESDFARVRCSAPENETWDGFVAGVRFDSEIITRSAWDRVPADSLRLDVLVVAMHSMSRPMFLRTMPRTYRYLVQTLGGVVMRGYNVLERGKAAALVPLTTGRDELELPEARRERPGRVTEIDEFPFVWKDFQQAGYVTAFLEDSPHSSVFSTRMSGFKAQPTDHYLRPFYLAASKNYSEHHDFCLGSIPRHKVTLDYASNFFDVYREHPKFLFAYFEELNGNNSYHLMGSADQDMVDWLEEMKRNGHLDHTLVVFLSDHGRSFPEESSTLQSKLEERLPFLSLALPRWFEVAHAWESDNLRANTARLATPYDVHATLLAVLEYAGAGDAGTDERAISLFRRVPASRTCEHAFVPPQWCACLRWGGGDATVDPEVVELATWALVEEINSRTLRHRRVCTPLHFQQLEWFRTLTPHAEMLPRRKTVNATQPARRKRKKYLPSPPPLNVTDASSRRREERTGTTASPWRQFCRLRITTKPGGVSFEALMDYRWIDNELNVVTAVISRVNQREEVGRCTPRSAPRTVREVCVCQDFVKRTILRAAGL